MKKKKLSFYFQGLLFRMFLIFFIHHCKPTSPTFFFFPGSFFGVCISFSFLLSLSLSSSHFYSKSLFFLSFLLSFFLLFISTHPNNPPLYKILCTFKCVFPPEFHILYLFFLKKNHLPFCILYYNIIYKTIKRLIESTILYKTTKRTNDK